MYYRKQNYSIAWFAERMENHKKIIANKIKYGVIDKQRMTPRQQLKAMEARHYYLFSKEKRLEMREKIFNKKLTRWL